MGISVEFPCRVGQIIYFHFQFRDKRILPFTRKAKVRKIYCANNRMFWTIDAELLDTKEKGVLKLFKIDDFGKIWFLSEEEAEQALKERETKLKKSMCLDSTQAADQLVNDERDLVPVVRCKDCKHRNVNYVCTFQSEPFMDDDFCSKGVRRAET